MATNAYEVQVAAQEELGRELTEEELTILDRLLVATKRGKEPGWYLGQLLDAIEPKVDVPDEELETHRFIPGARDRMHEIVRPL